MAPQDPQPFLEAVEAEILEALNRGAPVERGEGYERSQVLLEGARYLTGAPGAKRARPRLCFWFGQLVDVPQKALVDFSICAEFVHTASLLHDDVVDAGTVRRGRETVNQRWGNTVAVLSGDLLLCIALQQLAPYPGRLAQSAIELVALMSRATILEVQARGDASTSLERWREIARGKTGALFAWCGQSAAMLAGDERAEAAFASCGEHLGMAFQLADDLKDFSARAGYGKDPFADIRNRNPSFPMLHACEQEPRLREQLEGLWRQDEISEAQALQFGARVVDTASLEATREAIVDEVDQAMEALSPWSMHPATEAIASWARALCKIYLESLDMPEVSVG